ncbi:MAG: hypothetical protein ACREKN_08440 [Longimicrobiaceae bacterium]
MGNADFGYDEVSRLQYAEVACLDSNAASCHRQWYEYDGLGRGNMVEVKTQPRGGTQTAVTWSINAGTNRVNAADYDVAGNMTQSPYQGPLAYDSQDALVRMGAAGDCRAEKVSVEFGGEEAAGGSRGVGERGAGR